MSEEYCFSNIRLRKVNRKKLELQTKITHKSMSELINALVEAAFPDPPEPTVSPNLQRLNKGASLEKIRYTDEDFKKLIMGDTTAFSKFYKR